MALTCFRQPIYSMLELPNAAPLLLLPLNPLLQFLTQEHTRARIYTKNSRIHTTKEEGHRLCPETFLLGNTVATLCFAQPSRPHFSINSMLVFIQGRQLTPLATKHTRTPLPGITPVHYSRPGTACCMQPINLTIHYDLFSRNQLTNSPIKANTHARSTMRAD